MIKGEILLYNVLFLNLKVSQNLSELKSSAWNLCTFEFQRNLCERFSKNILLPPQVSLIVWVMPVIQDQSQACISSFWCPTLLSENSYCTRMKNMSLSLLSPAWTGGLPTPLPFSDHIQSLMQGKKVFLH